MKEDTAMNRLYASTGVLAIAAFLGWSSFHWWSSSQNDAFFACRSGNVAGGAIGGAFELVDQTGKTVTSQQIFTKPALIYFGYTSCLDVCPLDNARNVEAAGLLAAQGIDVTPVFISVDPARDTPAVLAAYSANFGDTMTSLTGSADQVKVVADAFKVYYKVPDNATGKYEVDHTILTYLMLPKIGFADFFQRETTAKEMADKVACFVKAS